jgi:hydroxyacid-oxoacid transhydrogenase
MMVGIGRRVLLAIMAALAVVADDELGDALAERLTEVMGADGIPNGLFGLGYDESDIHVLADDAVHEKRPVDNAPLGVTLDDLKAIYRAARAYW